MRVFLIEHPTRNADIEALRGFGRVLTMFDDSHRRSSVFRCVNFGRDLLRRMRQEGFDPEVDAVALVGSQIVLAVATAAIAQAWPRFNILMWRASEEVYELNELGDDSWRTHNGDAGGTECKQRARRVQSGGGRAQSAV